MRPIPFDVPASGYGRYIDRTVEDKLVPGVTSRKAVLLLLGAPNRVEENEKVFVYYGEVSEKTTKWFLLVCVSGACGGNILDYIVHYDGSLLSG
jgi:hypothetical protein